MLLPLAQLCTTSHRRMLGTPQFGAPQDQRTHIRADQAGGPKKPTLKPQGKGCSSNSDMCRLGRRRGRKLGLPAAAITTLQQSAKFKNLFDQLGLTAKERKIATEALVRIASGVGVECLSAEMPKDRALLQESIEITYNSEDIEVGHPDYKIGRAHV